MENTIIIKEDGRAINSDIHYDYSIVITEFSRIESIENPDGDIVKEVEAPPTIELRATTVPEGRELRELRRAIDVDEPESEKTILISTFYELEEASKALAHLVFAIENKEEIFDVREHNSNF